MKFTAQQNRKIASIFSDYNAIENKIDLKKRKLTLSEYQTCKQVLDDIRYNGKSETFIKNISDYFKDFGFEVNLQGVNYVISV